MGASWCMSTPLSGKQMLADKASKPAWLWLVFAMKKDRDDMKLQAMTKPPQVDKEVTRDDPPAVFACMSPQNACLLSRKEQRVYVIALVMINMTVTLSTAGMLPLKQPCNVTCTLR